MEDIKIIDNYMDEREFRNYIIPFLEQEGFSLIKIDDTRINDLDHYNNNDLMVKKEDRRYAVRALANYEITNAEVEETVSYMDKEKFERGIILTNTEVDDKVKEYAKEKCITIYDRKYFIK